MVVIRLILKTIFYFYYLKVFDGFGYRLDVHAHMAIILLPILLTCLITNLKFLAWGSTIANICMALGIGTVLYYTLTDIPDPNERKFVGSLSTLPLFFGTAIFSFEGIALVSELTRLKLNHVY